MTKKSNPFLGLSERELHEMFNFTTKIVADIGTYQQSNGQIEPSGFRDSIKRLKDYYARFMPEIYGRNITDLDGNIVSGVNARRPDDRLTQAEVAGIGPFRAGIQQAINAIGVEKNINEMRERRGLPPLSVSNAELAKERQQPPEKPVAKQEPTVRGSQPDEGPKLFLVEETRLPPDSFSPLPTEVGLAPPTSPESSGARTFAVGDTRLPPGSFSPIIDLETPDADAVYNSHILLVQSFLIKMGHGKYTGEPAGGLMNPGTRMAIEAYMKANDLSDVYKDPAMLAVHMHRNLRKGTVKPGVIEYGTAPATQIMSQDGRIVDQNGQTPAECFENAACPPGKDNAPAREPVISPLTGPNLK